MMPASRSMLEPGGARSSSSSSSTNAGRTPLPVPVAASGVLPRPEARRRRPWVSRRRPGAACGLAVRRGRGRTAGAREVARTAVAVAASRCGGASQVTSSVSSWKIGMPACVAGASSAGSSVRVGRVRRRPAARRCRRLGLVGRSVPVADDGPRTRRVGQRRQHDRLARRAGGARSGPARPRPRSAEGPRKSRSESLTIAAVTSASPPWLSTWSHSASRVRGMPARTWRGRSTWPCGRRRRRGPPSG